MDYMGIKHIAIHSPTTSLQQGQPYKFFITASYKTKPDIKLQEGEKSCEPAIRVNLQAFKELIS
jgi:hypothetical protein